MGSFTNPAGFHGNFYPPNKTSHFKITGIQKKSKLFPFESAFVVSYGLHGSGTSSPHFLLLGL